MQNLHEIDLATARTNATLNLGYDVTRIRILKLPAEIEIEVDGPSLPISQVGEVILLGCHAGQPKTVDTIRYTNPAGVGTVVLFTSDDGSDVVFSGAGSASKALEIVLATVMTRGLGTGARTADPNKDTFDPLGAGTTGDGVVSTVYDGAKEIIGVKFDIPVGGTNHSHAYGRLGQYTLPIAQIINTIGITHHRGRDWYVEFADTILTEETGTNVIRRGFGFGEIYETVAGFNKPFIGILANRGNPEWSLRARALTSGQVLNVPLTGYSPLEAHALAVRIGYEDTVRYVEARINGLLLHRELMPLSGGDLTELGSFPMNPWLGVARSLAADSVTMWGLLDGAMTLKLVYPNG